MVMIFGVVGIVGFITDVFVDNSWVAAVAFAAWFGAMVVSYYFRPQSEQRPPRRS